MGTCRINNIIKRGAGWRPRAMTPRVAQAVMRETPCSGSRRAPSRKAARRQKPINPSRIRYHNGTQDMCTDIWNGYQMQVALTIFYPFLKYAVCIPVSNTQHKYFVHVSTIIYHACTEDLFEFTSKHQGLDFLLTLVQNKRSYNCMKSILKVFIKNWRIRVMKWKWNN